MDTLTAERYSPRFGLPHGGFCITQQLPLLHCTSAAAITAAPEDVFCPCTLDTWLFGMIMANPILSIWDRPTVFTSNTLGHTRYQRYSVLT